MRKDAREKAIIWPFFSKKNSIKMKEIEPREGEVLLSALPSLDPPMGSPDISTEILI